MATQLPAPENVHLRYGATLVFERPDTGAKGARLLAPGDLLTVLGTEGEYYHVALPDGTRGFVYAHNLVGSHMPLTASEQHTADARAAAAAKPPRGWRRLLQRLDRRPLGRRG